MNIPTVKDFMTTNVITASADDSMGELIEKLLDKNVSGAPVVNDDNEIVGLISGKDILQGCLLIPIIIWVLVELQTI